MAVLSAENPAAEASEQGGDKNHHDGREFRPDWLVAPPALLFFIFVCAHAALWTLVPFLRNHNLPLDVIEHIAWGREWQLGYHKHPPLVSWMLETAIWAFGRSDFVIYGLSQACIAISFLFVWGLARAMLPPFSALAATLLCEGVIYHGFTSPEFNVNVASLPFWAATLFIAHRLYVRPPTRLSPLLWMLLGLSAAAAMLAKYTGILLLGCLLVLFLLPPAWHWWRTKGPYWAICVFTIAMAPHLIWLLANDFPTFAYALARGNADVVSAISRILAPADFIGSQLPAILPAIIQVAVSFPLSINRPRLLDRNDQFLILLGIGPLAILLLIALTFSLELKSMWGTTLFLTMGILVMRWLQPGQNNRSSRRLAVGTVILLVLGPAVYLLEPSVANGLLGRPKRTQFPGVELAQIVESKWQSQTGTPLTTVIGDEWLAGIISYYGSSRPSAYLNADSNQAPWGSVEQVSETGAVVLWMTDRYGSALATLAESGYASLLDTVEIQEQPPIHLRWATASQLPQVTVGWAIIPPQDLSTDAIGLDG